MPSTKITSYDDNTLNLLIAPTIPNVQACHQTIILFLKNQTIILFSKNLNTTEIETTVHAFVHIFSPF
jgi:hypothetical protein